MKFLLRFFLLICSISLLPTSMAYAEDVDNYYDLEASMSVIYSEIDENGDQIITEIEKVPSLMRTDNGTYKVTRTKTGVWKVSFYVTVKGNKITKADRLSINGSNISSSSLSNTSSSATCIIRRKVGMITVTDKITAKITNGKTLSVT